RLASRVRQAVYDRVTGVRQEAGRRLDPFLQARRLAPDGDGRTILDVVVEEPGLAQHAGVLRLRDAVAFDGQINVVTDAAAEGAGGVGNDLQFSGGHWRVNLAVSGASRW